MTQEERGGYSRNILQWSIIDFKSRINTNGDYYSSPKLIGYQKKICLQVIRYELKMRFKRTKKEKIKYFSFLQIFCALLYYNEPYIFVLTTLLIIIAQYKSHSQPFVTHLKLLSKEGLACRVNRHVIYSQFSLIPRLNVIPLITCTFNICRENNMEQ